MTSLFYKSFHRLPDVRAYAPGRIEFLGNHVDYNGGNVLGAAVDLGIEVALAARDDGECRLVSDSAKDPVVIELDRIAPLTGPVAWANYPLGVISIMREEGFAIRRGFDFAVTSTLPAGAGMSSSAALELATAYALAALHGFHVERKRMVRLCRKAENEFVGMPCGILDQGVSAFGAPDHLVHIDCLTETFNRTPIPAGCHFWMFNTNKKHALVDSSYSERHRACSEAFRILKRANPGARCLAHISPETVVKMREELGVERSKRALHVTEENRRVIQALHALRGGRLDIVGSLLTASHRSSQMLFENSCDELDHLVDRLTAFPGVYGARLSGGGFGGAVVALTDETFGQESNLKRIKSEYISQFGIEPTIFHTRAGKGAGPINA
ncbi:MAG TPA: galactokinase [Chthoniobacterales bacterium]